MITVLIGTVVLAVVTAVHEGGHWLAIRGTRGRVLRVQVGRGLTLWRREEKEPELVVALLPFGGRIDYDAVPPGLARVAVALSGSLANFLFAFLGFGLVRTLARAGEAPGGGPVQYALQDAGSWFWTVPDAIRELVATGVALELSRAVHEAVQLLAEADPLSVLYVASAVSAVWAAINLIPVPVLRTDGWLALSDLWRTILPGARASGPPPS